MAHRDRRQPLLHAPRPSASACSCRPATFLQFPHGRYSENLLRRDQEAIRNLYQSNGFRDVKVTARTEDNYRGKTGDIAVFLTIEEGPQYFVGAR